MTTASEPIVLPAGLAVLESGDRMSREEFHRIYEQMPEDFKAELIGGIVYVASPAKRTHGRAQAAMCALLYAYEARTPGVECNDNATVLLGEDSEPQPDLHVRILPECGGQSRTTDDDYVGGAPELIIEVALSSRSYDLHQKRSDYARYGGLEYLVLSLTEPRIRWFDLRTNKELSAGSDGVIRIRAFPGLWINDIALFRDDHQQMMSTLDEGFANPDHAAFVARLAEARKKHAP